MTARTRRRPASSGFDFLNTIPAGGSIGDVLILVLIRSKWPGPPKISPGAPATAAASCRWGGVWPNRFGAGGCRGPRARASFRGVPRVGVLSSLSPSLFRRRLP